jgi:hypothetical protein
MDGWERKTVIDMDFAGLEQMVLIAESLDAWSANASWPFEQGSGSAKRIPFLFDNAIANTSLQRHHHPLEAEQALHQGPCPHADQGS